MKRLFDLTENDLLKNPIWVYQGNNDDTAFIQPVDSFHKPNQEAYIAYTKFTLASGKVLYGYCSPTDSSGIDYIQPVIIYNQQHIAFWNDDVGNILSSAIAGKLELPVEEIFPIIYESLVPFEENHFRSIIEIAV